MPKYAEYTDEAVPHRLGFEAYQVPLTVCASSPELLEHAEGFLPPGWRRIVPDEKVYRLGILEEEDGSYSVYSGTTRISENQTLDLSLVVLEGHVRGFVALNAPERTFIHAGVVADDGHALVLPGYSFSGKTSLVAALVRAGATYYSDEFAVLDSDGLLHPYPKPLSVREGSDQVQVDRAAESLGGRTGTEPVRVGVLAMTYYDPGAEWQPKRLSAGESALGLMSHAVTARTRPAETMGAIRRAVEDAVGLESPRGDADAVAPLLLDALRNGG